jgi:hypothetical protein
MRWFSQTLMKTLCVGGGAAFGSVIGQAAGWQPLLIAVAGAAFFLGVFHWATAWLLDVKEKAGLEAEYYCIGYAFFMHRFSEEIWTFLEFRCFVEGFVFFMKKGMSPDEAGGRAIAVVRASRKIGEITDAMKPEEKPVQS